MSSLPGVAPVLELLAGDRSTRLQRPPDRQSAPLDAWTWDRPAGRLVSAGVGAVAVGTALVLGGSLSWTFWAGVVVPDLAVAAQIATRRATQTNDEWDGLWNEDTAKLYNALHDVRGPLVMLAVAAATFNHPLLVGGLGWLAHLAIDRSLGLGARLPRGEMMSAAGHEEETA